VKDGELLNQTNEFNLSKDFAPWSQLSTHIKHMMTNYLFSTGIFVLYLTSMDLLQVSHSVKLWG